MSIVAESLLSFAAFAQNVPPPPVICANGIRDCQINLVERQMAEARSKTSMIQCAGVVYRMKVEVVGMPRRAFWSIEVNGIAIDPSLIEFPLKHDLKIAGDIYDGEISNCLDDGGGATGQIWLTGQLLKAPEVKNFTIKSDRSVSIER